MTSDTTAGTENDETGQGASAPKRRRRATRPTAAPTAPAATETFGITLPARADAGTQATPAPATSVARPEAAAAEPSTPAPVTPESAAPGAEAEQPSAPKKRSRRATRPTASAAGSLDEIVLPERVTAPAPAEPQAAGGVRSLDEIVLPEGPATDAASGAEPPARKKATRTRRAKAEPAATEPATSEPATSEAATSEHADAEKPAKRSRAARTTRSKATGATKAAAAAEPVAEPAEPAVEPTAKDEDQPRRKATRTRGAGSKAAGTTGVAETAPAETTPAGAEAPAQSTSASPAVTGRGSTTPRLATTALLFQAPDLAAPRRPRRAQAPAGPPRPHDEPVEGRQAEETPAVEAAVPETTAPATTAPVAAVQERAAQSSTAPTTAAPEAAAPAAEAAAEPSAELTGDDAAAVEEVGAIEDELAAEGVELVDLGPEDLVDDDGDESDIRPRRRRRRGGRGRRGGRRAEGDDLGDDDSGASDSADEDEPDTGDDEDETEVAEGEDEGIESSSRRRRRRRRGSRTERAEAAAARTRDRGAPDEVTALKGSTRLEAKRQRRREGRDAGRRRQVITEAEFLARRESVTRSMVVREKDGRTQIAVLEDGVLVEHYVSQQSQASMVGNVYLGRVQNVLPSMEAAFVDVGKGRNAVLYAGEVNWDAAGLEGQPRRIEEALKSGDSVLVQVTKDPIGHKGARLTSQITLAGRYLVFVPGGGMTGISRKLPDTERNRLKKILREIVPDGAGVIVRTAAEGASEAELRADVERLQGQWEAITAKAERSSTSAPALLQGEPDLAIRVVRDIFNDDFSSLVVQGDGAWHEISEYVEELAPDLRERVSRWTENTDLFAVHRVDEQLAKGMDRKVWLPSGGSLVIDRTEAMTVIDVNTGKFTGAGGTLEETVTRNNLEAAEEIVRQLRLRDIGGIIVIDFIDMVLESNRDLVLRRLVECLGRDRTKHQVAEVTSLGLVQMTRKRVGQGLVEAFSSTCEHCKGRGFVVHSEPIERAASQPAPEGDGGSKRSRRKRGGKQASEAAPHTDVPKLPDDKSEARAAVKATLATIAAAAAHAHEHEHAHDERDEHGAARTDVGEAPSASEETVASPPVGPVATSVDAAATPADPVEPGDVVEAPSKGAGAEEAPEPGAEEAADTLTKG